MDAPAAVARLGRLLGGRRPRLRPPGLRLGRASSGAGGQPSNESPWQQRTRILPADRSHEFGLYPGLSLAQLRARRRRPRRATMLLRDFIDDSLYNPAYGYFARQALILDPGPPFDFARMRDGLDFEAELGRRYAAFEAALDRDHGPDPARQLWHTPSELFRPHYGEAIARYLVSNYRLTTYPYADLLIYEMGAGRGSLMLNILDHIRRIDAHVYARTRYHLIEISAELAAVQRRSLQATAHADRVELIQGSVLDWKQYVSSPCFFLAFEVFDNLAHDAIRYDLATEEPLQGHVLVDASGDLYEFYARHLDPLAARFFRVRHAATAGRYPKPYPSHPLLRYLAAHRPLAPNLSDPEFIPTRLMQFFDVLEKYFPAHRLIASDFSSLPEAIRGVNAPVVQTRYEGKTVTVTTPLVSVLCKLWLPRPRP